MTVAVVTSSAANGRGGVRGAGFVIQGKFAPINHIVRCECQILDGWRALKGGRHRQLACVEPRSLLQSVGQNKTGLKLL
jgi:hypothetical protein